LRSGNGADLACGLRFDEGRASTIEELRMRPCILPAAYPSNELRTQPTRGRPAGDESVARPGFGGVEPVALSAAIKESSRRIRSRCRNGDAVAGDVDWTAHTPSIDAVLE